ncbi:hypothetical protein CP118TE_30620 (plasmid) [Clostridium perfringens E]|nr:hypothetical protein CP118TE_30620 [Clostridium perfringens E]
MFRINQEYKKCIKILYKSALYVKEIDKLVTNNFSKDNIQKHIYTFKKNIL